MSSTRPEEEYALSRGDDQIYMGVISGADRVTRDGRSSRVISVNGQVDCGYVYDGRIYTLVYMISGDWSVSVQLGLRPHPVVEAWGKGLHCDCAFLSLAQVSYGFFEVSKMLKIAASWSFQLISHEWSFGEITTNSVRLLGGDGSLTTPLASIGSGYCPALLSPSQDLTFAGHARSSIRSQRSDYWSKLMPT